MAYGITEKGTKHILTESLHYDIKKKHYISDSIQHDLALSDITDIFSGFNIVQEIFTESELSSCPGFIKDSQLRPFVLLRSDRVLVLKSESNLYYVPLEYEIIKD